MKKLLMLGLILETFVGLAQSPLTGEGIVLDRGAWPYVIFKENGTPVGRIQGSAGKFHVTSTDGGTNFLTVDSSTGKVGIRNSSPQGALDIISQAAAGWDYPTVSFYSPNAGAYKSYIQYGPTGDWFIRSASGSGTVIIQDTGGNVGIGTASPSNAQGFHTVLDVSAAAHSKIIASATSQSIRVGLFADPDWSGGFIGTETNHKLQFITNYTSRMTIDTSGNVGIGTTSPNQKLTVNGTIYSKEVKVDLSVPGPDYVFEKSYALPSLDQVKSYIVENKHLPEVPSAAEMEKNGINVSEMNILLLKKVEELTLYVIDLKKNSEKQQIEIEELKLQIKK